jgi:uncharacterized membrane protein (UPF0127 family)
MTAPEALRRAALGAALALAVSAAAAQEVCDPASLDLRDPDGELRFSVEVVDDAAERAQGLMHRESLPRFGGMLFVYEAPQPVAFWMKNTLLPLDMLFFDGAGRLTRIKENAQPHDETAVVGGDAIRYVLEINAGLAAELGIDLGAELRHPALVQAAAAWPC